MRKLSGPISDRVRRIFTDPRDPAWNPPRGDPAYQPVPKGVAGHQLGGRKPKT
ncbi:hypothetical protein AB0M54_24555 [Actinoplanes sp. NPDC051470]|uniref:hypothetical protein n=1 Tax=Actinoplanes sp. NPDC051470 TaxID=3157224 RepID=UPI003435C282